MNREGVLFDREGMLQRMGGDAAMVREVLLVFFEDAPRLLDLLDAAVRAADPLEATRVAHQLKGAAASVGAEPLRKQAQQMEMESRAGCLDGMRQSAAALREALADFRRAAGEAP